MKKTLTLITIALSSLGIIKAQNVVLNFENMSMPAGSYYEDTTGADLYINDFLFQYDFTLSPWGNYWSGGFTYSNMVDSVTSGYGNMYAAKTAGGYANSNNYMVSQNNSVIKALQGTGGQFFYGFYITNSTYAYNSMRDGDAFAKKFGGTTGTDPDWFKVVVRRYFAGALAPDSVEFYLADFRSADSTQDYIVDTWEYVDLSSIGSADSLQFTLSSSDVGTWGMNTPAFFCMDNLNVQYTIGLKEQSSSNEPSIYPNPAGQNLNVQIKNASTYSISDLSGKVVLTGSFDGSKEKTINLNQLSAGIYFINANTENGVISRKFVKE